MLLAHYADIFRKNVCHKEIIFGFHFSSKGVLTYLLERGDPGPVARTAGPREHPGLLAARLPGRPASPHAESCSCALSPPTPAQPPSSALSCQAFQCWGLLPRSSGLMSLVFLQKAVFRSDSRATQLTQLKCKV